MFRYVGRGPFRLPPSCSQRAIPKAFLRCFRSFCRMVHFVRPREASPRLDIRRASRAKAPRVRAMSCIPKENPSEDQVPKRRSDMATCAKSSKGFSGPRGPRKADVFGFLCKFDHGALHPRGYSRYLE
jgi:hypothetical protein